MIRVTRLNGTELVVNADLILSVEATPDTVVTFTNRDRIVVKETSDEVVRRVIEYQRNARGLGKS
jgi:flagellar protein FlbD